MIYFKNCISRLSNTWRGEVMRVYLHWLQNDCYTVCNSRQQDQWQGRDSSRYSLSAMVQSLGILKGGTKDHILWLQVMVNESRCKRARRFIILNSLEFNLPKQTLFQIWLTLTKWLCIFLQYLVLNKEMNMKKVYRPGTNFDQKISFEPSIKVSSKNTKLYL